MADKKKKKPQESDAARKARQKAFYTKQREDAERDADKSPEAARLAAKIHGKLAGSKPRPWYKGGGSSPTNQAEADKAMDYQKRANVDRLPKPLRGAARAAGSGLDAVYNVAPYVTTGEGMGLATKGLSKLGSAALGRGVGAAKEVLGRWGSKAARSGIANAAKVVPAAERSAVQGGGTAGLAKASRAAEAPKNVAKPEPKAAPAPKPTADAKPHMKVRGEMKPRTMIDQPKAANAKYGKAPAPKAEAAPKAAEPPKAAPKAAAKPAPKPAAKPASPEGEHPNVTAFRTAAKGSEERKAAWKAMTKEQQAAYKAGRGEKTAAAEQAAKPKRGRPRKDAGQADAKPATKTKSAPKAEAPAAGKKYTDHIHEAYETENMNLLKDKADIEAYKARYTRPVKQPDGSVKHMTIPRSGGASAAKTETPAAGEAAPKKGGFVKEKIKAAMAAKKAAAAGGEAAKATEKPVEDKVYLPPVK